MKRPGGGDVGWWNWLCIISLLEAKKKKKRRCGGRSFGKGKQKKNPRFSRGFLLASVLVTFAEEEDGSLCFYYSPSSSSILILLHVFGLGTTVSRSALSARPLLFLRFHYHLTPYTQSNGNNNKSRCWSSHAVNYQMNGEDRLTEGRRESFPCVHTYLIALWMDRQDAIEFLLETTTFLRFFFSLLRKRERTFLKRDGRSFCWILGPWRRRNRIYCYVVIIIIKLDVCLWK